MPSAASASADMLPCGVCRGSEETIACSVTGRPVRRKGFSAHSYKLSPGIATAKRPWEINLALDGRPAQPFATLREGLACGRLESGWVYWRKLSIAADQPNRKPKTTSQKTTNKKHRTTLVST